MDSAERDEIDANIPLFLRRPGLCDTHQGYSYLTCLSSSLVPHPYLTVTISHKQIETTNTLSSHSDEINVPACKLSGLVLFCKTLHLKRGASQACKYCSHLHCRSNLLLTRRGLSFVILFLSRQRSGFRCLVHKNPSDVG